MGNGIIMYVPWVREVQGQSKWYLQTVVLAAYGLVNFFFHPSF